MISRLKIFTFGIILIFIFTALASCKPKINLSVEVVVDKKPLRILIPRECVAKSWLYQRRVSPAMLQGLARIHTKDMTKSHDITTELMVAIAKNQHSEVVRLLNSNVDVEETSPSGCTALMWAITFERKAIVSLLLDEGADVNQSDGIGVTPLMIAALTKNSDIFLKLHAAGANINAAQTGGDVEIGTTVLHHAVTREDNFEIINFLIDAGNDVKATTKGGRSALMKTAFWRDGEYILLLLNAGADIERKSNSGSTALQQAMGIRENLETLQILIDKGANVNNVNNRGKTPLMDAAFWGNIEAVKLLIKSGADLDRKSNKGETALDFARARKRSEIVTYLESLN